MHSPGGYVPAIDGLRALAVLAVLLFHAGFAGASGGYLGVSVFFTISGFVITRSLLMRAERRGRRAPLALGQFYARRVRRLLPAALATIVLCALASRAGWLPRLGASELRWTVLHGANWFQWRSGDDYAAMFAGQAEGRDPLVHFWSLAIEEQFYVVWPLLMLAALRVSPRARGWLIGSLTVALSAYVVAAGQSAGARTAYYHTFWRAPEILIGCSIALLGPRWFRPGRRPRAVAVVGVVGAVVVAAAVPLTGSGSDSWPYRGLLPVFAVASAAVVLACSVPGPVARVLALRPLVELGRVSYGVYLFHWPIFVVLLEHGGSAWEVAALGVPVTVALAVGSFHLAEAPIARARVAARPTLAAGSVGMIAVFLATTLTAQPTPTTFAMPELDPDVLEAVDFQPVATHSAPAITAPPATSPPATAPSATAHPGSVPLATSSTAPTTVAPTVPATVPATAPALEQPMRILVVGDSTAQSLSVGLTDWALEHPDVQVSVAAFGACGLVRGGQYRLGLLDAALQVECAARHARTIPEALPLADVVVVLVTLADVWERSWDGGESWHGPDDPTFRQRLEADYAMFAESVAAAGVPSLVWLRPPVSAYATSGDSPEVDASFENGAQEWIETVVAGLVAARPGLVSIGDLRGWFEASGLADDPAARPDGTHFAAPAARRISDEWLVPLVRDLPRRG